MTECGAFFQNMGIYFLVLQLIKMTALDYYHRCCHCCCFHYRLVHYQYN